MSKTVRSETGAVHQVLERHLAPLLGGFTAQMAIRTAALRALQHPPEATTRAEVPALLEGLRPMLNTFLGAAHTRDILEELKRALEA